MLAPRPGSLDHAESSAVTAHVPEAPRRHRGSAAGPRRPAWVPRRAALLPWDRRRFSPACRRTPLCQPPERDPDVSILAHADDFPATTAKIRVEVPGLVNLAEIRTNFFRLTGDTPAHTDNHWGTADTLRPDGTMLAGIVTNTQLVALDFLEFSCVTRACATLGINDMSVAQGGVFDICGTWHQEDTCRDPRVGGHISHRTGTSVDIDQTACLDPNLRGECLTPPGGPPRVPARFIRQACLHRGQGRLNEDELPKLHCEFPR